MFRTTTLAGNSKLNFVLGLSLCTLGGALLYAYFKQRDGEEDATDKVSKRKQIARAQLVIANEHVPVILGRNGSNLTLMEAKTRTKIRFRDKDNNNKYCEITGVTTDIREAHALIMKEVERSPIVQDEINVPQNVYARIIGRCGDAMQEICRASMAKVSLDAGSARDAAEFRRIKITGNRMQVNLALKLLEEKIEEDQQLQRSLSESEQRREPRRSPVNSVYSSESSLSVNVPPSEKLIGPQAEDTALDVYVSAIASPSKFWVQIVGAQTKKLDDMVEEMTAYYDEPSNRAQHVITEPYLGQIVAAAFKSDGKWYRAEIVSILPNQYDDKSVVLDLYFVDYGDSEYVAPHEVYELRTDFLTLRFQAVECFLANVKSTNATNPDSWDMQACEKFEDLSMVASWKKLIARVVTYKERPKQIKSNANFARESSPIPGVELFDLTDGAEINVGQMLIMCNHALPLNASPRSINPTSSNTSISTFHSAQTNFDAAQTKLSADNMTEEEAADIALEVADDALNAHFSAQLQHNNNETMQKTAETTSLFMKNANGNLHNGNYAELSKQNTINNNR